MIPLDFLGVAPFVIISSVMTWFGQAWLQRQRVRKDDRDAHDRIEIHRDELTFELLQNARQEMSSARIEVEDLRDEVRKLRSMEQHFYHFQQSLDHIEALLFPDTHEARANAERNARAFLNRMRRLNEAKGTIANEVQRTASRVEDMEKDIVSLEKGIRDDD